MTRRGGREIPVSSVFTVCRSVLIIPYQQLIDRFPFLGNGADRTEDAQPLDMETVVQVVEEGVQRILLARVGVG